MLTHAPRTLSRGSGFATHTGSIDQNEGVWGGGGKPGIDGKECLWLLYHNTTQLVRR